MMTASPLPALGRRSLLGGGVATLVVGSVPASASGPPAPVATPSPRRLREPFTLGIASGDPLPSGVVLWTRLAVEPLSGDGRGGMPAREVLVEWAVAEDESFTRVVRSGSRLATPDGAHSVHVEVDGLRPGREYHYRFRAEGHLSPVGRTRTAPGHDESPRRLTVAVASCAQFEHGFFTAYRRLADESPDLVLHLGDYLYEEGRDVYETWPHNVRHHRGGETVTLADYRRRHAQYKTDPDLQHAHAVAPWSVVFDDHEVEGNWAGDVPRRPERHFVRRRAAAFRAYYENMPLRRTSLPAGPDMRIYRRIRWGDLATVHLLDTRQYRSDQADGHRRPRSSRRERHRSILGHGQERWLLDGLRGSTSRWDVIAQQVFLAQKDSHAGPGERVAMDAWDGYPAARRRLLRGLGESGVRNPVVLTGDVHRHYANELRVDFDDPATPPVGVELVTTSVSSGGDGFRSTPRTDVQLAENPHIRYVDSRRGYLLTTFERDRMRADFKVLPYVQKPGAPVSTAASFVVPDRRRRLHREDPA
jgi:alkaline phosphatase D